MCQGVYARGINAQIPGAMRLAVVRQGERSQCDDSSGVETYAHWISVCIRTLSRADATGNPMMHPSGQDIAAPAGVNANAPAEVRATRPFRSAGTTCLPEPGTDSLSKRPFKGKGAPALERTRSGQRAGRWRSHDTLDASTDEVRRLAQRRVSFPGRPAAAGSASMPVA
jgi:hypothetical protein